MKPMCSLTVPSEISHAALVRSCLLDVVDFDDEDAASSFLIAVTEVFVNAVQASRRRPPAPPVTVEFWEAPTRRVTVVDRAGGIDTDATTDTLGLGLRVARTFVPTLSIEANHVGTSVVLSLDTPS